MIATVVEQTFIEPEIPEHLFKYSAMQEAWEHIIRTHKSKFRPKQKGQLIFGLSGAGKSTLAEVYESCFERIDCVEATIIPVLRIKILENTHIPSNLMEQLVLAIGAKPISDRTGYKLRHQVKHLLKEHKVELLLFDECQQSLPEKQGIQGLRMVKFFKEILEEFNLPIVFFGTPKALRIQAFGQNADIPIDEEQLSRDMYPSVELRPLKPRTTKWLKCVNFFLESNHLPTLNKSDSDLYDRLYLAQRHKTFSHLATLFEEYDFSPVKDKSELLHYLKLSYDMNLRDFGANPFDESIYDETAVETQIVAIREKMEAE
ncbi:hypothetical protein NCCP2140_24370 [Pseudoalteromonas sp. NCCP-2140]|uniref:TniB family NTP-binding protein n=1 Tax=Pseudoalteromonas sp. NCCP-2140 TaxID=2942288 RepID=UPI00203D19BB|nr:TniB family NTP-binding protein [Pseudoalteromonas sp. NCCP-2140]GKW53384.1 hypothetical protein NCCP2140_24370 [Pseudoalteromonas sp. NCCP-2140]